jgi:hypothetical protein
MNKTTQSELYELSQRIIHKIVHVPYTPLGEHGHQMGEVGGTGQGEALSEQRRSIHIVYILYELFQKREKRLFNAHRVRHQRTSMR